MRIQWSSSVAQEILRYMRTAGRSMDAGMGNAKVVEAALADANPGSDNSVLNRLSDEFHDVLIRLEKLTDAFDNAIHLMQDAIDTFEDAEREISSTIDRIETGVPGEVLGFGFRSAQTELMGWTSEPRLMPVMHRFDEIPAPTWLQELLEDPEVFNWISD